MTVSPIDPSVVRVLLIEDNPADVDLIQDALAVDALDPLRRRAQTRRGRASAAGPGERRGRGIAPRTRRDTGQHLARSQDPTDLDPRHGPVAPASTCARPGPDHRGAVRSPRSHR